jgi:hypothetical protein
MSLEAAAYVAIGLIGVLVLIHSFVILGLLASFYGERGGQPRQTPADALLGEPVPSFKGVDIDGAALDSSELDGKRRAFLFVSPTCADCSATLGELRLVNYKSQGNVVAVCLGEASGCRELLEPYQLALRVIVDESGQIGALFGVTAYPTAVLIGPDDTVESHGRPERAGIDRAMQGVEASAEPTVDSQ